MPSCFYSCQDLVSLTLYNCLLKPPSTFKGFRSLKNLYLREVTIAQDVLHALIDCCSLLERLTLRTCSGLSHLKINAPNLQFFDFAGSFENLNLENMLNLVEVFIDLDCSSIRLVPNSSSHLVKFFVHLPLVRRITIQNDFLQVMNCVVSYFNFMMIYMAMGIWAFSLILLLSACFLLQYLAEGASPEKLSKPCLCLNFISITIGFCYADEVLTALCLLGSAPALQELKIQVSFILWMHKVFLCTTEVCSLEICFCHNLKIWCYIPCAGQCLWRGLWARSKLLVWWQPELSIQPTATCDNNQCFWFQSWTRYHQIPAFMFTCAWEDDRWACFWRFFFKTLKRVGPV